MTSIFIFLALFSPETVLKLVSEPTHINWKKIENENWNWIETGDCVKDANECKSYHGILLKYANFQLRNIALNSGFAKVLI